MPLSRRPLRAAPLLLAALLLAAAAPLAAAPLAATPVPLQSNPGTQADAMARKLAADDLESARSRGDKPLVLTGRGLLGGPQPALFVQLQSEQECGSAGCTTSAYSFERGQWQRVLDSATGKLTIAAKKTHGRNDIITGNDHYVWTGRAYASIDPAPPLNLHARPRPRPHR